MINQNLIIIGVLLQVFGGLNYFASVIKGKAKPNRVTWFLWALAPMIAFSAEIKQGVGLQSLVTFMAGFGPILVLIASFISKKSEWKLSRLDYICGALALFGLLLWYVTKVGNVAILFSIIADGLAAVPTIVKSYFFPETESYIIYLFGGISSTIVLLTISNWNFANFAFPAYLLSVNIILVILIKFKLGKK